MLNTQAAVMGGKSQLTTVSRQLFLLRQGPYLEKVLYVLKKNVGMITSVVIRVRLTRIWVIFTRFHPIFSLYLLICGCLHWVHYLN